MKSLSATIQMKATEQYFPVILVIMLYKVVLTFKVKITSNQTKPGYLAVRVHFVPFLFWGVEKGRWFSFVRSFVSFVCDFMFMLYPLCNKYLSKTVG